MRHIGQLINGNLVYDKTLKTLPIYNPATGEIISALEVANKSLIDTAVAKAKTAFKTWKEIPPIKRARILFNYKLLIEKNINELAQLITQEHGKTLSDAKGSIQRGLEVVEFACNIPALLKGEYSANIGANLNCYTMKAPLGVCLGITPFNFPAMVPLWMFPLAIACGNSFILKPSERNPSVVIKLVELLYQSGLPDNVVQVINGDKITVNTLLKHPDIAAVSSVGSTTVAKSIYETASHYGKRVQALGGAKNHAVILPDADIDFAAEQVCGAAFGSAGQRCMALSVAVIVNDNPNFINALVSKTRKIKVGSGLDPSSDMGPLNTPEALERVRTYIDTGITEGAELLVDGRTIKSPHHDNGFFIGPSIFQHVETSMKIYKDEIFGPLLCLVHVNSLEDAITLINQNEYANGTAIFTRNGHSANDFTHAIQVGMVGVNVPIPVPVAYHSFGGWKQSLFGDSGMHGNDGIKFYTKNKVITERWQWQGDTSSGMIMPSHE